MGIKNISSEDRCFCEIGIDLEFFTVEQAQKALEEQRVEATIGNHKKIGAFLFEQGLITKDQISKILRIQDKLDIAANDSQGKDTPTTEPTPIGMYFVLVITGISILGQISSAASTSITSFLIMYGISFFAGIVYSLGVCLFSLASIISFIITIHYFKNGPRHLPKLKLIANICAVVAAIGIYSTDFGGLYYSSSTMNLKLFKDAVESSQVPELAPIKQAVSYGYNSAILEFAKGYLFFAGFLYLILLIQWGVIRFCIPSAQPVEAGSSHIGNAAVSDKSLNSAASGEFEHREGGQNNMWADFSQKSVKLLKKVSFADLLILSLEAIALIVFAPMAILFVLAGGSFSPEFTFSYLVLVILLSLTNVAYVSSPRARVKIKELITAFKKNSDFAIRPEQANEPRSETASKPVENASTKEPKEGESTTIDTISPEELPTIQWCTEINMLFCLVGFSCYHSASLLYISIYLILLSALFAAARGVINSKAALVWGAKFVWNSFTPKYAGKLTKISKFAIVVFFISFMPGVFGQGNRATALALLTLSLLICILIFRLRNNPKCCGDQELS